MPRLHEKRLFAIFGPWHVVELRDPLVPTMETENKKAKESEKRIVRKEEELLRKYSLLVVFLCHLRCRNDPTMVLSVSPSSEYRIMRMRALLSILMISIAERDPGGRER
jgi:hypothetical protein